MGLVLTRKIGQGVVFDGRMIIKVIEVRGKQVRLSFQQIDQSKGFIPIVREEFWYSDGEEECEKS